MPYMAIGMMRSSVARGGIAGSTCDCGCAANGSRHDGSTLGMLVLLLSFRALIYKR